jgi:hypothetical protein
MFNDPAAAAQARAVAGVAACQRGFHPALAPVAALRLVVAGKLGAEPGAPRVLRGRVLRERCHAQRPAGSPQRCRCSRRR